MDKYNERNNSKGGLGTMAAGVLLGAGTVLLARRADRDKLKNMTQGMVDKIKASFRDSMDKAGESVQSINKGRQQLMADAK